MRLCEGVDPTEQEIPLQTAQLSAEAAQNVLFIFEVVSLHQASPPV
jgi:hypothetical protein